MDRSEATNRLPAEGYQTNSCTRPSFSNGLKPRTYTGPSFSRTNCVRTEYLAWSDGRDLTAERTLMAATSAKRSNLATPTESPSPSVHSACIIIPSFTTRWRQRRYYHPLRRPSMAARSQSRQSPSVSGRLSISGRFHNRRISFDRRRPSPTTPSPSRQSRPPAAAPAPPPPSAAATRRFTATSQPSVASSPHSHRSLRRLQASRIANHCRCPTFA